MIPGEYFVKNETITLNSGKEKITVSVSNIGDRPIQVGSHFHFFEVNKLLSFDRNMAFGMRLNIPSGTAVRFEPGEEKDIELIPIGGNRIIYGLNGLTEGSIDDDAVLKNAMEKGMELGFEGVEVK